MIGCEVVPYNLYLVCFIFITNIKQQQWGEVENDIIASRSGPSYDDDDDNTKYQA